MGARRAHSSSSTTSVCSSASPTSSSCRTATRLATDGTTSSPTGTLSTSTQRRRCVRAHEEGGNGRGYGWNNAVANGYIEYVDTKEDVCARAWGGVGEVQGTIAWRHLGLVWCRRGCGFGEGEVERGRPGEG
eukprot:349872-Chlamydomonas_euryale.AAC.2